MFTKLLRGAGGRTTAAIGAIAAANTQQRNSTRLTDLERPSRVQDDWMLADINNEHVYFQPYSPEEIRVVVEDLRVALPSPPRNSVQAIGYTSDSTDSSEGNDANAAIESLERSFLYTVQEPPEDTGNNRLSALLQVSTRLLSSPGIQRELVKCMHEDPEIAELLISLHMQGNLDSYLNRQGFHTAGLLPPAATVGSFPVPSDQLPQVDTIEWLVCSIASTFDAMGSALGRLGMWLRNLVRKPAPADASAGVPGPRGADKVLGGAFTVAVAIFCMLLIRRPLVFRATI